jgi:hypothetical protein
MILPQNTQPDVVAPWLGVTKSATSCSNESTCKHNETLVM